MLNYVSVVTFGYGDNRDFLILYAGIDYETAKNKLIDFQFPDPYNNYGYIKTWVNGEQIKIEYIRE